MQKAKLNFIVDAVAFSAFVLLAVTGVLMRYILPPGSGHFNALWGMDRHAWGRLHFWIAVGLLAVLGLHLFLHWRWIVATVKGRSSQRSNLRIALAIVGVILLTALAATPFFGRVEKTNRSMSRLDLANSDETSFNYINGAMTLNEIEQLTNVPSEIILKKLGLPTHISKDIRLGRLRKVYGFEIHELREAVQEIIDENQR